MRTSQAPHRQRAGRSWRLVAALALAGPAVLAMNACSGTDRASTGADGATGTSTTTSTNTSTTTDPAVPEVKAGVNEAAFRGPGPFEVGVTTLALPDRKVEVWYPAKRGSTAGVPVASYSQLDALPANLAAAAPALLPADVPVSVLTVTMTDTYRDVPGSADGPFPLVLFSHGYGSYRLDASSMMRGMASWGFVVAAPDHLERGRAAVVTGTATADTARDVRVLLDTIPLVGAATGPLAGLADTTNVGAVGHSAGGRAALTALSQPQIKVAIGWAAAGRENVPAPDKPSMNIAARTDVLVPLPEIERTYAALKPPKRLVVIDGAGHNSFTDICLAVRQGNDLIGLAQRIGIQIPESLAAGGRDGCSPQSIDTKLAWEITQNFTVAELRNALGLDKVAVGLGPDVTKRFTAKVEYRQDPP